MSFASMLCNLTDTAIAEPSKTRRAAESSVARLVALVVIGLLAASCGASGGAESTSEAVTSATVDGEAAVDGAASDAGSSDTDGGVDETAEVETSGAVDIPFGNCSSSERANPDQVYSVSNIPANDPDGGLVARLLPGSNGQRIDVLPDGTIVEIRRDDTDCVVLGDGSVWWFVNTPLLATGGYVNSAFVAGQIDLGQESDGQTAGGEDDFDVELAQIDCVYGGAAESCDLLTLSGVGSEADNYGLGNSYAMAPSGFLAEDCLVSFDGLACAELEARGPGTDIRTIANAYIDAYQRGDATAQASLSGEQNTSFGTSDVSVSSDPDVAVGVASANYGSNSFTWTEQPTLFVSCIVEGGLVQFCTFAGD